MKMVKNLTLANIRNIDGMVRREDLDFADDGNHFKGFTYKNMPITTLRADGETYLTVRVGYLKNSFTYKEWFATEEDKLCDEFNGVSEFDLDKLIENLERIIAKVDEMNAKAEAEDIDTTEVEQVLKSEIEYAEKAIADFKANYDWFNADNYRLKNYVHYAKNLQSNIDSAKAIDFTTLSRKQKAEFTQRLKEYGYVTFRNDGFYIKQLKEAIAK
jgi:hypothetical protein